MDFIDPVEHFLLIKTRQCIHAAQIESKLPKIKALLEGKRFQSETVTIAGHCGLDSVSDLWSTMLDSICQIQPSEMASIYAWFSPMKIPFATRQKEDRILRKRSRQMAGKKISFSLIQPGCQARKAPDAQFL
jgi:hypothetical protein